MKAYRIGNTPFRFCSCRSTFMSLVMKYVVFNADFIAFSKFPSAPDRFAIRNGSGGGPKDSFPQSTYRSFWEELIDIQEIGSAEHVKRNGDWLHRFCEFGLLP